MLVSNSLRIQSRPSLNSVTSVESDFVSKTSFRRTGDAAIVSNGIAPKAVLEGVAGAGGKAHPVTRFCNFLLIWQSGGFCQRLVG